MLAARHSSTIKTKKYWNKLWGQNIAIQETAEGYWAKIQWREKANSRHGRKGFFQVSSLQTVSIKKIFLFKSCPFFIFIKLHKKQNLWNLTQFSTGPNYHIKYKTGRNPLNNNTKSTLLPCLWGWVLGGIRVILPQDAPGSISVLFLTYLFVCLYLFVPNI